jgi:hypothetical protein
MERPCIGAASLVSLRSNYCGAAVTYETKIVDICRRQVFDLLQAKAPFCLCYNGQLC